MKLKSHHAALLLCLCICRQASSQKPASSTQTFSVTVTNAHITPAQPVPAVRVSLSYLDSGTRITEARDVTNPKGQAFLQVTSDVAQRGDLRIEITGATDLVIYQPADGQLPALPSTITIQLLPKGSPALAGAAQIEALQRRLSQHVSSLQAQNTKQQTEIKGLQSQLQAAQQQAAGQRAAVDEGLEEWAKANGLDLADAKEKIQQWARDTQSSPGASAEQKALAAFALKDYATAASDFGEAEDAEIAALDEQKKQQQEQNRSALSKLLQTTTQKANALQLAARYHDATSAFTRTRDYIAAQQAAAPQDTALHSLWLRAASSTSNATELEGEVAPASQSLPLLAQASAELTTIADEYDKIGDREGGASARNKLGYALESAGERASGTQSAALLYQSVQAFQKALDVYTKADHPQYWAMAQMGLGNALMREGERATIEKSITLLEQAKEAFRGALQISTKNQFPQDWARAQMNLGNTLAIEGKRSSGARSTELLNQAVQAYLNALEIFTKADLPQDWAMTQVDLGGTLMDEAATESGDRAVALHDQSAVAFRNALQIYTKENLPQDWARAQGDLGADLVDEGEMFTGDKSAALFDQGVQAFQHALEVYTKADLPQDWARTQSNLGLTLTDEGQRVGGDQSITFFNQALHAFSSALDVYTKTDFPHDWAWTENNVAALYHDALFKYDKALETVQQVFLFDPSADNSLNFVEANLTAGKFDICLNQITKLGTDLGQGRVIVRDTLTFACANGAGLTAKSREAETTLLRDAPTIQGPAWSFPGTIHYLASSPAFAAGRASWIALFTAIQNGDSAGMTAALHQLEPLLKN